MAVMRLDGVLQQEAGQGDDIDRPREWTSSRKAGLCFAQKGQAIFPPANTATAGPAVCGGIWPTYKNVMGSSVAVGGRDLFPTC